MGSLERAHRWLGRAGLLVASATLLASAPAAVAAPGKGGTGENRHVYSLVVEYDGVATENLYGATSQDINGEDQAENFFGSQKDGLEWKFKADTKVEIASHSFTLDGKHHSVRSFVTKSNVAWQSATSSGALLQNLTEGCDASLYEGDKTCEEAATRKKCAASLAKFAPWTRSPTGGDLHVYVKGHALVLSMTEPGNAAAMSADSACAAEIGVVKPSVRNGLPSIPGNLDPKDGPCAPADAEKWQSEAEAAIAPTISIENGTKLPFKTTERFDTSTLKWYPSSCPENSSGLPLVGPPQSTEEQIGSDVKVSLERVS